MCETKGVRNKPLKPGHFNLAGKRTFQNGLDNVEARDQFLCQPVAPVLGEANDTDLFVAGRRAVDMRPRFGSHTTIAGLLPGDACQAKILSPLA